MLYLIQLGLAVYEPKDGREGFGLVEALRELHGVGQACILRLDGTPAVLRAGSDYAVTHAPTGREIVRRRVRNG